jgi:hypothetical protein
VRKFRSVPIVVAGIAIIAFSLLNNVPSSPVVRASFQWGIGRGI